MKTLALIAIVILIAVVAVECQAAITPTPAPATSGDYQAKRDYSPQNQNIKILGTIEVDDTRITVFYDKERDVTCWLANNSFYRGQGTGISCMKGLRDE